MTPEQISALTALAAIVAQMGTWPIGSILLVIAVGPWIGLWIFSRAIEHRFRAVIDMYEANVKLVKNFERMAEEQIDTIRLNVAAITELTTWLRNRVPCHERIAERLRTP